MLAGAATLVVASVAIVFVFPFAWMLFATFKSNPEVFRPLPLLPAHYDLDYYRALLDGRFIPFPRQLVNSLLVAAGQTVLVLGLTVPAGYVFGRCSFRGRRWLFAATLATIVLPQQILALPLFVWMHALGLYDTLLAVLLPGIASGLGVVFFTLVFRRVPRELVDSARGEGASEGQVLRTVLPLVKPAVFAFALIHFVLAWQEHLLPLVLIGSEDKKTVPLALASLYGSNVRFPYALLMVGSLLTTLPTAVLYVAVRRHFRSALAEIVAS
jgi:multiple sugar transport system permease protein